MRRPMLILHGLVLAVLCATAVPAQQAKGMVASGEGGDGLIVRIQSGDLVFIDRGAEHGVARGDLFDVVSSEVLVHPLSDSILAVTPKTVGAVQVLQVYTRTSLARLVHLEPGEDPMLKPIMRVTDPERIEKIEKLSMRGLRVASGMDVSRRVAIVPGLYQLQIGETRKGWGLLGAEALAVIGGFTYRSNSNDWYDQYQNLPAGLPQNDYDFYFTKAQDRRTMSNRLFWLAGALYLYNWADILWLGEGASMAQIVPHAPRLHVDLDWGGADGLSGASKMPLLRLTRRF